MNSGMAFSVRYRTEQKVQQVEMKTAEAFAPAVNFLHSKVGKLLEFNPALQTPEHRATPHGWRQSAIPDHQNRLIS